MDEYGDDADFAAIAKAVETPNASKPPQASSSTGKVQQPKPQALPNRSGPSAILVSTRQKGNPSLNYIRSLPWEYSDIPADYILGATTCALFLSLKYHRLHPEYIYSRIKALGHKYNLRILLAMVDIQNHEESLKELSKTSLINNLTLILCWSAQEAGRYLELYKSYEHASPTSIRAHQATTYPEKLVEFITVPRSINKTDAVSLVSAFGTIRAAVNARPEQIGEITGWGEKKVQRWCNTVHENFRVKKAAKRGLLNHEESSMALQEEGEQRQSTPIPLSRVPVREMREATTSRPGTAQTTARSTTPKRPASDVPLWEPGSDDEEAFLAAAEAEDMTHDHVKGSLGREFLPAKAAKAADTLDEGVASALAKLRKQ